ncbi:MAG: BACON domain-containing protein [Synergistaceae bacterium]|nr:BACON domain-containing protein [Synergistaceae bacterium]
MTSKRFYVLSFVMLFLFALLTSGGCGSSGNGPAPQAETSSVIPDMSSIFDSEEFSQVMSETKAELIEQGINVDDDSAFPDIHFVMIVSGDGAYIDDKFVGSSLSAAHIKTVASVTPQEISAIGRELLPAYESGDIIAMYFPTDSAINTMYQALNENVTHFDGLAEGSGDTYPEIYAIAKRYGVNAVHRFSYTVPGSVALLADAIITVLTSGDEEITPEGGEDDTSGNLQNEYDTTLRQEYLFQARRYASFVKWAATLDKRAAELDAQAVSAHAALLQASDGVTPESQSGNFLSMNSQNHDHDFSYFLKNYEPWRSSGQSSALSLGGSASYAFDINYAANTSWTIFAAHNFNDGDDYYLVKQTAFSSPIHTWSGEKGSWSKCHFGQIVNFNVEMQVPNAGTSDVSILKTAPRNVARKGSVTDGISTSIGGTFGGATGGMAGLNMSLTGSLTYTHSKTWETSEWTITNNSGSNGSSNTKWDADFDRSANYDTGEISDAGRHRVEFDSEWIWRVKKSFWSRYKNVPLRAWSTTWTGFTRWANPPLVSNLNEFRQYGCAQPYRFNMLRPSHIYVNQKSFSFTKDGGQQTFKLLCNSDYTITSSNPDWCQISAEQRIGSDTGTTEREIFLVVTPFTSSASGLQTRTATITIRETSTGDEQKITVVQSN